MKRARETPPVSTPIRQIDSATKIRWFPGEEGSRLHLSFELSIDWNGRVVPKENMPSATISFDSTAIVEPNDVFRFPLTFRVRAPPLTRAVESYGGKLQKVDIRSIPRPRLMKRWAKYCNEKHIIAPNDCWQSQQKPPSSQLYDQASFGTGLDQVRISKHHIGVWLLRNECVFVKAEELNVPPAKVEASHLCFNGLCFNPDHIVIEGAEINADRKLCSADVDRHCNHVPNCIRN